MPSAPLHDPPDPRVAERLVGAERAFLHRTFELLLKPVHQPVHLEVHARIDEGVEVAAGVLQSQGVRVWKIRSNMHMKLRGQPHQTVCRDVCCDAIFLESLSLGHGIQKSSKVSVTGSLSGNIAAVLDYI